MKRIIAVLITLAVIVFALASCASSPAAETATSEATQSEASVAETTAPSPTSTPSPSPTPSPTITPSPTSTPTPTPSPTPTPTEPPEITATVVEVVDGDTIRVNLNGVEDTLRLIGIDTPETKDPRKPVQCFGEEASKKAHELLDGQTVILRDDPTQDTRDKYGRLLMYCWRASDGLFYNLEMIKQGYAHEYTYEIPYQYQTEFKAAQTEAMNAERGLWSPTTCDGDTEQAAPTPEPATPAPTLEPTQAPSTGGLGVIANLNTGVYHYPDCSSVPKITNPVPIGSPSEAIAAGCRPCKRCNPPTTP